MLHLYIGKHVEGRSLMRLPSITKRTQVCQAVQMRALAYQYDEQQQYKYES